MLFIITIMLGSIIGEIVSTFFSNDVLNGLWSLVFNSPEAMGNYSFQTILNNLYTLIYSIGVGLIILKLCVKAFSQYVLWNDGDPDVAPSQLVIKFAKAIVVAICFPYLFKYFADIGGNIVSEVLTTVDSSSISTSGWAIANWASFGFLNCVLALVFLVMVLILYFKLMVRGIQVEIMLVGTPLACTGLLDDDKGVWKAYLNTFVKVILTTIVQIVVCKIGLAIAFSADLGNFAMSILWGIACMIFALGVPKLMSEFLLVSQGGGITQKMYSAGMAANMMKHVFKR